MKVSDFVLATWQSGQIWINIFVFENIKENIKNMRFVITGSWKCPPSNVQLYWKKKPINMHTTLPIYAFCRFIFHLSTVITEGQCHKSRRKVPPLHFNGLFFHAKRNNRVFCTVPAEPSVERRPYSHPLSLVVTWRTLAVLGFCLILVSGGRTHPFFMVYMHTTTDSKELGPVPKMRFAFAHAACACFLIILCNLWLVLLPWSTSRCILSWPET